MENKPLKAKRLRTCLTISVLTAALLAGCDSGNHATARFGSREEADAACNKDLKEHIESEIKKSSDSRFYGNWTLIKTKYEEYAILDFGCKPVFKKGSSTGELLPFYFYLDGDAENTQDSLRLQIVSNLKPKGSSENGYNYRYSYPLNGKVDFDSLPPVGPTSALWMPYSSKVADSVSQGIAIGAVMRTCRNLYNHKKITPEEAEKEILESRNYLKEVNTNPPLGPLSSKGSELSLKVLDARWEKCKAEEGKISSKKST